MCIIWTFQLYYCWRPKRDPSGVQFTSSQVRGGITIQRSSSRLQPEDPEHTNKKEIRASKTAANNFFLNSGAWDKNAETSTPLARSCTTPNPRENACPFPPPPTHPTSYLPPPTCDKNHPPTLADIRYGYWSNSWTKRAINIWPVF